jgi:UDPglucose 6-dehydrogenase
VAEYWHQVIKINDYQKERFAQKIIDHFKGNLTGKKIAILGWAFKANTNDSRESPAIYVAERLYKDGATLEIYDPMVSEESILNDISNYWNIKRDLIDHRIIIIKSYSELDTLDAYAILTEWEEFKESSYDKNIPLFDGRNLIKNRKINQIGI